MYKEVKRSRAWFLLPIFLQAVGGVIAFFVLRNDDPKKAKNCLFLGIALTAAGLVMGFLVPEIIPFTPIEMESGSEIIPEI